VNKSIFLKKITLWAIIILILVVPVSAEYFKVENGLAFAQTASISTYQCMKIKINNQSVVLINVSRAAGAGGTQFVLKDASKNDILVSTWNIAENGTIGYTLLSETEYFLCDYNDGNSFTLKYNDTSSYPINTTFANWIGEMDDVNEGTAYSRQITAFTISDVPLGTLNCSILNQTAKVENGLEFTQTASISTYQCMKIKINNQSVALVNVSRAAGADGTQFVLKDSFKNNVYNATWGFVENGSLCYTLLSGQNYYLCDYNDGNSFTLKYNATSSYPINTTFANWIGEMDDVNEGTAYSRQITAFTIKHNISLPTPPFDTSAYNVTFPYADNAVTSNNNLTINFTTTDPYYNHTKYTLIDYQNTLENGLIAYYPFEETSGNAIDVKGVHNLTLTGTLETIPCIKGSCRNYTGNASNYFSTSSWNGLLNFSTGESFTFNVWANFQDNVSVYRVWGGGGQGTWGDEDNRQTFFGGGYNAGWAEGTRINYGSCVGTNCVESIPSANISGWRMYTITKNAAINASQILLYIDGVYYDTQESELEWDIFADEFFVGARRNLETGIVEPMVGYIDELGIWDRSLTTTELQELYDLSSVTNATNIDTVNTSYTFAELLDGRYYYGLTIYDDYDNSQFYDPNVTIDTTAPTINFTTGTTPNGSYIDGLRNIFINISYIEENPANITYYLYNTTGLYASIIESQYNDVVQYLSFDNLLTSSTGLYNATNTSGAWSYNNVTKKIGSSINMETSTASINLSDALFRPTSWTITFWFYPKTVATGTTTGVFWRRNDYASTWGPYWMTYYTASGIPRIQYVTEGHNAYSNSITSVGYGSISTGSWYYVTATYNNNTRKMKLYINAQEVTNFTKSGQPSYGSNNWTTDIGDPTTHSGTSANFMMDEFAHYARELTDEEIKTLYNGGTGKNYTQLPPIAGYHNFTNLPNGQYYYNATVTDLAGQSGSTPTWQADIVGNFTPGYYTVTAKYAPGTYTNDNDYYVIGNTTDIYFDHWSIVLNNLSYYECYQETANDSNVLDGECGLTYNGVYTGTGTGEASFYVNYTKPIKNINGVVWNIKAGVNATPNTYNIVLPEICTNQTIIQLLAIDISNNITTKCYNGINWQTLSSLGIATSSAGGGNTYYDARIDGDWNTCMANYVSSGNVWRNSPFPNGIFTLCEESIIWRLDNTNINVSNIRMAYYNLLDGIYYNNISATDKALSTYLWQNYFTIDTIYPTINYTTGTTPNGSYINGQGSIFINITINDTNVNYSIIRLYNASGTLINSTIGLSANYTNFSTGIYYYNATVTDLTGQSTSTPTYIAIIIDTFQLQYYNVTFQYENNSYSTNNSLAMMFTSTDPYYDYAEYEIRELSYGYTTPECYQQNSNDTNCGTTAGLYYIVYGALNSADNVNGINQIFVWYKPYGVNSNTRFETRIGLTANPVINWTIPKACLDYSPYNVTFAYTDNCGTSCGPRYLRCYAGTTGNAESGPWMLISAPQYTSSGGGNAVDPTNSTQRIFDNDYTTYLVPRYLGAPSIYWATVDDGGNVGNHRMYDNAMRWYGNTTKTVTVNKNMTFPNLANGRYYYSVRVYDKAGNSYLFDPYVTIDATPPNITYSQYTTLNGSYVGNSSNIYVDSIIFEENINTSIIRLYNSSSDLIDSVSSNSSYQTFILPYYFNDTSNSVWVKTNLVEGQTYYFTIKGGNVSKNSGDDVFEFFDDFEGPAYFSGAFDSSKWNNQYADLNSILGKINGTYIIGQSDNSLLRRKGINTTQTFGLGYATVFRAKDNIGQLYRDVIGFGGRLGSLGDHSSINVTGFNGLTSGPGYLSIQNSTGSVNYYYSNYTSNDVFHIYQVERFNNTLTKFYQDYGTLINGTVTDDAGNNSLSFMFASKVNNSIVTLDWVGVYKVDVDGPSIECSNNICKVIVTKNLSNYQLRIPLAPTSPDIDILVTTNNVVHNFTSLSTGRYYYNMTVTDLAGFTTNTPTYQADVVGPFMNDSYTITFPYPNNAYTNNNTLTYGFTTVDPYYNYTIYNVTNLIPGGILSNAYFCYQESTNTPNQTGIDGGCGLNYTGNYYASTGWYLSQYPNLYDGNWGTSSGSIGSGSAYIIINYTKPIYAINTSLWRASDGHGPPVNRSIPNICWNAFSNKISFKMVSDAGTLGGGDEWIYYYCYNSTDYQLIDSYNSPSAAQIYEEAMLWNMSLSMINVITNATSYTVNLLDGKYYYGLTIYDKAGNNYFYDPNITIDTTPPIISFVYPTPNNTQVLYLQDYINVSMLVSDANNITNLSIMLYKDGVLLQSYIWYNFTTSTQNYTFMNLTKGTFYINASAYDIVNNLGNSETRQIILFDYVPYVNDITIQPTVLYGNTTIGGYCNITHDDLTPVNVSYVWYNNGINVQSGVVTNVLHNIKTLINNYTLSLSDYDNNIIFGCQPFDVDSTGNQTNTTSYRVNYIPTYNMSLFGDNGNNVSFPQIGDYITLYGAVTSYDAVSQCSLFVNDNGTYWNSSSQTISNGYDYCYQESTNTSNQGGADGNCRLDYSGSYVHSYPGGPAFVYINYTKPIGVTNNSKWIVKNGALLTNISLPNSCWNAFSNKLSLRLESEHHQNNLLSYSKASCYNGSWVDLVNSSSIYSSYGGSPTSPDAIYDGDWDSGVGFVTCNSCSPGDWRSWIDINPLNSVLYEEAMNWYAPVIIPGNDYNLTYLFQVRPVSTNNSNVSWYIQCMDTYSTTFDSGIRQFTVFDVTHPVITFPSTGTNFNLYTNTSVISHDRYNVTYNISYFDYNLFAAEVIFTCDLSGIIYNWSYIGFNVSNYTQYDTFSIDSYPLQRCQFYTGATDSHTNDEIPKYQNAKLDTGITFLTENDNTVQVIANEQSNNVQDVTTKKMRDRHTFTFDFVDSKNTRTFRLLSNNVIYYVEDSIYPAHFVIWNPEEHKGNWIDFADGVNVGDTYNVEKINDYEYHVIITTLKPTDKLLFTSIGGTLLTNYTSYFYIGGSIYTTGVNTYKNITFGNYSYILTQNTGYPTTSTSGTTLTADLVIENLTNGTYTYNLSHPNFFPNNFVLNMTNDSLWVNYTTSQAQANFQFQAYSSAFLLSNVTYTLYDNLQNITITGNTGNSTLATFNIDASNYTLNYSIPGYYNGSYSFTISYQQIYNYTIDVSYPATFQLYDEKTLGEFNISSATVVNFLLFCPGSTYYTVVNSTNFTVPITCDYLSFKFELTYGTNSYYRSFILTPDETNNVPIYLIDASNTVYIYNSLVADDLLKSYVNPSIYVYKNIGNRTVQITANYVDITQKVGAYLIANNQYTVVIKSDNNPDYSVGIYAADASGTVSIKLYSVSLYYSEQGDRNPVFYSARIDNSTGDHLVLGSYVDTQNQTASVQFNVYAGNSLIDSQGVLNTKNAVFTSNVSAYYNISTIYGEFIITRNTTGTIQQKSILHEVTEISLGILNYVSQDTINWILIILLGVLAIIATMQTANYVSIALIFLASLFVIFGWLTISASVLAIAGFVALISLLKEGERNS